MDDLFQDIEMRIRSLLQKQEALTKANHQLQQIKFNLTREKEHLLLQKKNFTTSIENMLVHLKTIEGIS